MAHDIRAMLDAKRTFDELIERLAPDAAARLAGTSIPTVAEHAERVLEIADRDDVEKPAPLPAPGPPSPPDRDYGEVQPAALAHMARIVEDAQNGKADAQRLADRVSAVFVPVVIAIAVNAFVEPLDDAGLKVMVPYLLGQALIAAGALVARGVEVRHLRPFRTAAEREVELVEHVVGLARMRGRGDDEAGRAGDVTAQALAEAAALHEALVVRGARAGGLR